MLDSLSKIIIIIIMNSISSIQMDNLNLKRKGNIREKSLKRSSDNSARIGISVLRLYHQFWKDIRTWFGYEQVSHN